MVKKKLIILVFRIILFYAGLFSATIYKKYLFEPPVVYNKCKANNTNYYVIYD